MNLIFEIPGPTIAEIYGESSGFPVRRVFCVGRNYRDHVVEMGADPDREPPFFFTKWAETVTASGSTTPYPSATSNLHHEAELVVAIGKSGRDLSPDEALDHVFGYATGLDLTRRDLQLTARAAGRPWDPGKNFECSAPIGTIHKVADIGHATAGPIRMLVNGEVRQDADLKDLIWPVADIVSFLSGLYRIEPGDLIFTGTPAGVGPVVVGDDLRVEIAGLSPLQITIGPRSA